MTKKYRLKKDLPYAKAGEIKTPYDWDEAWFDTRPPYIQNPDWFEPVGEENTNINFLSEMREFLKEIAIDPMHPTAMRWDKIYNNVCSILRKINGR